MTSIPYQRIGREMARLNWGYSVLPGDLKVMDGILYVDVDNIGSLIFSVSEDGILEVENV